MEQVQIAMLFGAIAGGILGLVFGAAWGARRERKRWTQYFTETYCKEGSKDRYLVEEGQKPPSAP